LLLVPSGILHLEQILRTDSISSCSWQSTVGNSISRLIRCSFKSKQAR